MHLASSWQCQLAAHVVGRGGVIAYPTESVWGLGCDPYDATAVRTLLAIKQRPEHKGLILLSGHFKHFEALFDALDPEFKAQFLAKRERPTTWLVPDFQGLIPTWIKGKHHSVALRLSSHPAIVEITRRMGTAIVSTSANPAGSPTAGSSFRVRQYFQNELDYILPGSVLPKSEPSQIRDLLSDAVIRA